ncbi:MAG: hypothetical protein ACP5VS_08260 [Desulfomonilaceae bacterium]
MDYNSMTREELLNEIQAQNDYMSNIIVFWGDKRALRSMFNDVARNENDEFTEEEAQNAKFILETDGAFEQFIGLLQDSFEKGGIYHAISEKMSYIMEQVARGDKIIKTPAK